MASKLRRVNPGFPLLGHIHHAGTVQVVVPQLAGGTHVRQMHKVIHVVGVVDDLPDGFKAAPGILQGGVQLRKRGGVQRFQPGGKEIQFVHVGGQHHIIGNGKVSVLRAGISVDEKNLRIVRGNPDIPQGGLQLFGCGRQIQPDALFALFKKLAVMDLDRKYFVHAVTPFFFRHDFRE